MAIVIHRETPTLVFLGNFTPEALHPSWFAYHGLIAEKEAQAAESVFVSNEFAQFLSKSFFIKAFEHRIEVRLVSPEVPILFDFAKKLFVDVLVTTPIHALGANLVTVIDAESYAIQSRVGKALAPWQPWGKVASNFEPKPRVPNSHGGMVNLTMRTAYRTDDQPGHVQIQVQPSVEVPSGAGIMISINNHFQFGKAEDVRGPDLAVQAIDNYVPSAYQSATEIVNVLKDLCDQMARNT